MNTTNQILIIVPGILILFSFFVYIFYKSKRYSDGLDELYKKISEEIKYAVAPKSIEISLGVNDLVDLAIEVWRGDYSIK